MWLECFVCHKEGLLPADGPAWGQAGRWEELARAGACPQLHLHTLWSPGLGAQPTMGVGSCDQAMQGPEHLVRNVDLLERSGDSQGCSNEAGDCSDLVYVLLAIVLVAVNHLGEAIFAFRARGGGSPGWSRGWWMTHSSPAWKQQHRTPRWFRCLRDWRGGAPSEGTVRIWSFSLDTRVVR